MNARDTLTSDAKKLKLLRHAGDTVEFLLVDLTSLPGDRAGGSGEKAECCRAELRQVEHSASVAEQQWTESASSNAVLIREGMKPMQEPPRLYHGSLSR